VGTRCLVKCRQGQANGEVTGEHTLLAGMLRGVRNMVYDSRGGAGVGKGAVARHDIAQVATAHAAEFAGGGDWSARTRVWA
jgi:hypothetical protein